MNVEEVYTSFTGLVDVGKYALFVKTEKDGAYLKTEEIINQAVHFPRLVFIGKPLEQKNEITVICKKIIKEKPSIKIEINTDGTIKPTGIGGIDNIIYNVHLKLKISGIKYKQRILSNVITWFNQIGANFIFNVTIEDEVDEVNLIVQDNNINKKDVYLTFKNGEQLEEIKKWAMYYKYNFAPNFKEMLWPNSGE